MTTKGHKFHPSVLREYDIRGVVGKTLTTADALAIGRTLGTIVCAGGGRVAVVGYDGRHSSPSLEEEVARGLASCGLFVLRIGLVPTPAVYFASKVLNAAVGVMITGSHNPPEYNGFKMVVGNKPFYGDSIKRLGEQAARGGWLKGEGGIVEADASAAYIDRIMKDYPLRKGLRVAWDPGNGATGDIVVRLARRLPGDHFMINEKIDGNFPAHHPDPTVEANLEQLKALVAEEKCDIGIGFDGDGDRIGVVDGKGRVLWGDQLIAILARDVLARLPGSTIIADVKASQMLFDEIARLGGEPEMAPSGHSIIKHQMARKNSPLAGEMSGHIFMADIYYGYDDAPYVAVRLLRYLMECGKSIAELRDELPKMVNTPEIRFDVSEERKFAIVDEIKERLKEAGADVNDIDGVRVNEKEGWWLIRASNTQNSLVARCEASNEVALEVLKTKLSDQLAKSGITVDFNEF